MFLIRSLKEDFELNQESDKECKREKLPSWEVEEQEGREIRPT
jgi:hypothetical protein